VNCYCAITEQVISVKVGEVPETEQLEFLSVLAGTYQDGTSDNDRLL
jgi:hypothetical protein